MGKEDESDKIKGVEEGEISDTASVEEITEDDFNKLETGPKLVPSKDSNRETRVWTMSDLYKNYPNMCYGSGLYNFAWSQAVQNKPLNDIFVMEADTEEKSNRSSSLPFANGKEDGNNVEDEGRVVIDVEKEEGELEEGEIDMDTEFVEEVVDSNAMLSDCLDSDSQEIDLINEELDEQVKLIQKTLDFITIDVAQKSFQEVCTRLYSSIETFFELIKEKVVPRKDALIQRLYAALRIINSVFCSMNPNEKEEYKHHLSRLLSYVKNCNPPLFSPEQIRSVEVKIPSTDSHEHLPSIRTSAKEVEIHIPNGVKNKDFYSSYANASPHLTSSTNLPSDSMPIGLMAKNNLNISSDGLQSWVSNVKGRGPLLPLLDLHKVHDADSLPSPTREAPTIFSVKKSGHSPAKVARAMDGSRSHAYETDVLKAVSSYQQKFFRSSFSMADRLPSPTPSEEFDGGGDIAGEVSSSSIIRSSKASNSSKLGQNVSNSPSNTSIGYFPNMESSITKGLASPLNVAPPSCVSNPTVKPLAKSRDPRLRMVNSDASAMNINPRTMTSVQNPSVVESAATINLRKKKMDMEPNIDGTEMKRQKIESQNHAVKAANDLLASSGSGGWLEDTTSAGPRLSSRNQIEISEANASEKINVANNCGAGNELAPTSTSNDTSLPSLLKDIVVNPTMLLSLLKMSQQQELAAELKLRSSESERNAICPTTVSNSLVNAPSATSGILQQSAGTPSVPSPPVVTLSQSRQDDLGKVRMKPRDPRRILHGNSLQKVESLDSPNTDGSKDIPNGHKQEGQGYLRLASSQPLLPDIGRQFTNNLKNIADIMSVPSPPTSSQNSSSKAVLLDRMDTNAVGSSSIDSKIVTTATPAVDMVGPSRSQGAWGDLEHLFEGYNDKQKAAIQRERARRIDEQKKMFAARKLCLVLDLDHTLLNSAKFVEVDPVHDEILRSKEELDREKVQRHLFRFPHMGMWTKLRPGVWNFLEKASEIYELHLYTMGNKLYATEMAKILDPKGVLFSGRVISRGDDGDQDGDERVPKSKDLEGVLGMESAVVIVDDSIRVWPHNKMNLIVVERYTYFPCSRRQFGLLGPSLLEIDHDERPEDGTLASSLAVIQRIHQTFFSHPELDEVDVRNILASEQQRILAGCRIVFSRVFPVGEAKPHLHPLWQTAEQFGAVCTNQIDDQVTHVVANSLGTDKVNWALSNGRFVVHPGWVEASALLYRRANEQDFAIKP